MGLVSTAGAEAVMFIFTRKPFLSNWRWLSGNHADVSETNWPANYPRNVVTLRYVMLKDLYTVP